MTVVLGGRGLLSQTSEPDVQEWAQSSRGPGRWCLKQGVTQTGMWSLLINTSDAPNSAPTPKAFPFKGHVPNFMKESWLSHCVLVNV